MNIFKNAFNEALEQYYRLADLDGEAYKKALYAIVMHCQEAIAANRRDGDALVLLANAYYLVAITAVPGQHDHDMTLRAAHVIQHWFQTRPKTKPVIAENARKLDVAIRDASSIVLKRDPAATAAYLAILPPGHLEDSLRDRLAVSTTLFPAAFGMGSR